MENAIRSFNRLNTSGELPLLIFEMARTKSNVWLFWRGLCKVKIFLKVIWNEKFNHPYFFLK